MASGRHQRPEGDPHLHHPLHHDPVRILAVEEVNLANKEIKIQCANIGADTEAANP